MRLLSICFFLFAACAQIQSESDQLDDIDKVLLVMKTKTTTELVKFFGEPDEISLSDDNKKLKIYRYKKSRVDAYVYEKNRNKISHLTIFFFKDFDNYTYLKKRFEKYKWLEKKLPDNKSGDVASDKYHVEIPELGMQFEYDNHTPKRKVMWIYFE